MAGPSHPWPKPSVAAKWLRSSYLHGSESDSDGDDDHKICLSTTSTDSLAIPLTSEVEPTYRPRDSLAVTPPPIDITNNGRSMVLRPQQHNFVRSFCQGKSAIAQVQKVIIHRSDAGVPSKPYHTLADLRQGLSFDRNLARPTEMGPDRIEPWDVEQYVDASYRIRSYDRITAHRLRSRTDNVSPYLQSLAYATRRELPLNILGSMKTSLNQIHEKSQEPRVPSPLQSSSEDKLAVPELSKCMEELLIKTPDLCHPARIESGSEGLTLKFLEHLASMNTTGTPQNGNLNEVYNNFHSKTLINAHGDVKEGLEFSLPEHGTDELIKINNTATLRPCRQLANGPAVNHLPPLTGHTDSVPSNHLRPESGQGPHPQEICNDKFPCLEESESPGTGLSVSQYSPGRPDKITGHNANNIPDEDGIIVGDAELNPSMQKKEPQRIYCLFYVYDPELYKSCEQFKLTTIATMKQHISRHHKGDKEPKYRCTRCGVFSRTQDMFQAHNQNAKCTKRVDLTKRSRGAITKVWNSMYVANFGEESPRKSPYMEESITSMASCFFKLFQNVTPSCTQEIVCAMNVMTLPEQNAVNEALELCRKEIFGEAYYHRSQTPTLSQETVRHQSSSCDVPGETLASALEVMAAQATGDSDSPYGGDVDHHASEQLPRLGSGTTKIDEENRRRTLRHANSIFSTSLTPAPANQHTGTALRETSRPICNIELASAPIGTILAHINRYSGQHGYRDDMSCDLSFAESSKNPDNMVTGSEFDHMLDISKQYKHSDRPIADAEMTATDTCTTTETPIWGTGGYGTGSTASTAPIMKEDQHTQATDLTVSMPDLELKHVGHFDIYYANPSVDSDTLHPMTSSISSITETEFSDIQCLA